MLYGLNFVKGATGFFPIFGVKSTRLLSPEGGILRRDIGLRFWAYEFRLFSG